MPNAMSIKVVDVEGEKLLTAEETAKTQDFIVCDNPVFVVRDVREMVDFENAKAERQRFSGENAEFAMQYPRQDALLTRFARSGFLKYAKGTPFAAEYWSQTPSAYGEGLAVKYFVRPWPQNDLALRPRDNANFLQEAMRDRLVTRKAPAYFDFCIECQTDPLLMPVEDPMVRWLPGGAIRSPSPQLRFCPLPSSRLSRRVIAKRCRTIRGTGCLLIARWGVSIGRVARCISLLRTPDIR